MDIVESFLIPQRGMREFALPRCQTSQQNANRDAISCTRLPDASCAGLAHHPPPRLHARSAKGAGKTWEGMMMLRSTVALGFALGLTAGINSAIAQKKDDAGASDTMR
jgi:hypothetical protein